jgi:hypothetical protein
MINIQRQLKELLIVEQKVIQAAEYVFAKRVQIINALFIFVTSSIEEKCQRRAATINALVALCKKQKSQDFCRRKTNIKIKEKQTSSFVSSSPNLSKTLSIECKAIQCIFCLDSEDLSTADRLRAFVSRGDLKKHFHRKHLRHHSND